MIAFILIFLINIPIAMLRGLVMRDMWHWYISPLTHNDIGIVQAIGMSMFLTLMVSHLKTFYDKKEGEPWYAGAIAGLTVSFMASLLFWFFGWVWHFFL